MPREIIHFSHANGFPATCYRKLFGFLAADFEIGYIDTLGHDPAYPVSDGWLHLVRQLSDHIATHYERPVIAVGHSLGGYLSFMAACQRPELFRAIVLLDSPIPGTVASTALMMTKTFGFVDRVTPGYSARNRRNHWPSVDEVLAHFRHRKLFRRFDPDCLRDYATLGTVPSEGGVRLKFDPEIESRIYCTFPHDLFWYRGRLTVPAGFIAGRDSEEVRRVGLEAIRWYFPMRIARVEGGHLFPFEHPESAAVAIRAMIGELLAAP